jgi:hypothetical protein
MTATRQLRLIQGVCAVFVVACVLVAYLTTYRQRSPASEVIHSLIVVLGVWSAIGGFTFQRKLLKKVPSASATKSNSFKRWRAGHVFVFGPLFPLSSGD